MLGVSEWCFGRSDEMCERSVVLSRHCVAFVAVRVADVLLSQVAFVALDLDLETRLDSWTSAEVSVQAGPINGGLPTSPSHA